MRKYILIGIIIIIVILVFLFFVGFSRVSINKNVYFQGEQVLVSFSDFRLLRCNTSPSVTNMIFYYETPEGWKRIMNEDWHVTWGGIACVDGKIIYGGHPGDIKRCAFSSPYESGVYTWDGKVYESKGIEEVCGDLEVSVPSFQSKAAPPGIYKLKFGSVEKTFEIKKLSQGQEEIKDETVGWQTYRNEEYRFEIKYPLFYEVLDEWKEAKTESSPEHHHILFLAQKDYLPKFQLFGFNICVQKLPPEVGINDLLTSISSGKNCKEEFLTSMNVSIISCRGEESPNEKVGFFSRQFYFISPQRFLFEMGYLHNDFYNNDNFIREILSTFRFLD